MKKRFFYLIASCLIAGMTACSSNDDPTPDPTPDPVDDITDMHFDLYLTVGQHGGMNLGDGTIVRTLPTLNEGDPTVDIVGKGLEFRYGDNTLSMESIVKDGYYYQVPNSGDRFIKFKVSDTAIEMICEQPFVKNTFKVRSYTHAWLPGNVLLIMAVNGDGDKVLWTKLNGEDLRIVNEGELELALPQGAAKFTTSGIASFNEKTGELYYFFYGKTAGSGMKSKRISNIHTAVINPSTMMVISDKETDLAEEMAGSAYGELMQQMVTYDESGNLYLIAFSTVDGNELGKILRINAGESDFDPSFNAFPNPEGKIHTIQYLADGKALVYARVNELGTKTGDHSRYYAVVDLETGKRTRLSYNGTDLPYCSGGFSMRTAVAGGKAYVGVTPENGNPAIYIYDIADGTVVKGVDIAPGYYFDILRIVDNK